VPTYLYRFEDGETIEVTQSIHDDPHTQLPHPKYAGAMQPVKRIPQVPGATFKGDGWARGK
jgi:predicted nucleic acid-binding Zn ribbon protein